MVIAPATTLINWENEFKEWIPEDDLPAVRTMWFVSSHRNVQTSPSRVSALFSHCVTGSRSVLNFVSPNGPREVVNCNHVRSYYIVLQVCVCLLQLSRALSLAQQRLKFHSQTLCLVQNFKIRCAVYSRSKKLLGDFVVRLWQGQKNFKGMRLHP